jgi:hypothetical protein
MDCDVFETMLEEVERELSLWPGARAQALQHAESCAYCRAQLAAARLLSLELRALAEEDAGLQAPPRVEAKVMAAYRARAGRRLRMWRSLGWAGAAAALWVGAWLLTALPRRNSAAPAPRKAANSAASPIRAAAATRPAAPAESRRERLTGFAKPRATRTQPRASGVAGEFIALAGSSYPMGEAMVVRVQVPRSAPALLGLPAGGGDFSGGTVSADVVLGEDGVARGIRFVQPQ